jgi:xylulokinase
VPPSGGMDFVIGLDLGTAGSRAVAVGADGRILAVASAAHRSLLTGDGRVEQDPADWWESAAGCLREVTRQAGAAPLAVGLSGQMDGPVLLGGDGEVLGTCHIWADSRAAAECGQVTDLIGAGQLIAVAGKPAVPAYTAPKLLWIKAHESRRFAAARRVLLPKDYLRWRLTGTQATDPSDASNTLLFDVTRRRWSAQLTGALGLPAAILPDVAEPAEVTGRVTARAAAATGLAAGVPVVGGAGDSITAAIANALVPGGPVLTVLGSAGNVSAVFAEPLIDPAGRIHTGCHATPGTWIATGVQQAAGLALQWLRGLLAPGGDGAEVSYARLAALAAAAEPGSDGLTFLPYLAGTRSPEYDPGARGAFTGLSLGHTAGHLVRAVMEGVAFTQRESAEVLAGLGVPVRSVVTAGGGARSAVWRGIQAGVLGVPVSYYPAPGGDSSALGAAILAGVGSGLFDSLAGGAALVRAGDPDVIDPDPAEVTSYRAAFARYREVARAVAPLRKSPDPRIGIAAGPSRPARPLRAS